MNKKQQDLKKKILSALERRKTEVIAKMQKELSDVDRRILRVKRGEYSLWGKVPQKHKKILLDMGVLLFEIRGEGTDVVSWDVKCNG